MDDADDLFLIRSDPLAMQHWDWPGDLTRDETRAIAKAIVADVQNGEAAYWTARTAGGAFVGLFDLSELRTGTEADLGFMVQRRDWGAGYAFEAASALINEAWSMGIPSLKARAHAGNERSIKLLIRLGFREAGSIRPFEIRPGVFRDCAFFSLPRRMP
jgi:ribosomal-protein-alanine N-acetyltransferase